MDKLKNTTEKPSIITTQPRPSLPPDTLPEVKRSKVVWYMGDPPMPVELSKKPTNSPIDRDKKKIDSEGTVHS